MKKTRLAVFALLALSLALAISGAAFAQEAVEERYPGASAIDEMTEDMNERYAENMPKVVTMSNGVQVQRTPSDANAYWQFWHAPNAYNTYYLDADNRGCAACHTDLVAVLDNMDFPHLSFESGYVYDMEVQDCMICHNEGAGYIWKTQEFGTLIHGIHRGGAFSGDCWTCHTATADGRGMLLWEEAKYDVLQGIKAVADIQGEFTYDQSTPSTADSAVNDLNWMSGDSTNMMAGASLAGLPLDPDLFDNWEISITGAVENPITMTLKQMIETYPSTEDVITNVCVMNPNGGPLISNSAVKGVSISALLEAAGVKDTATAVMSFAPDGWNRGILLSELEKDDAYLVYECNGERLSWGAGYPLTTWNSGGIAPSFIRQVTELRVVEVPEEEVKIFDGWKYQDGEYVGEYLNKPMVGIFNLYEGQILEAGVPHTFEGYADGLDKRVTAIEFSMDRGATWTSFDVSDTNRKNWVYWNFTYTPENVGAYVFSVRAVTEDGLVTVEPEEMMINVKQ
ncbi:MAG: molybdopterin-dependent oxidoreductase [Clostridia bacterium]|nr:molybdopterin-dependent oxidoreductase [Clostridia bacterium]